MAPSSRKVLVVLAAELGERVPELAERVVSRIITQEVTYQPGGSVPRDALIRSVTSNLERILAQLAGQEMSEEHELAVARATGHLRAQQGVPLEAVLRAYRLATQVLLHEMLDQVRGSSYEQLSDFLDVTAAVMQVSDRNSEAVVAGYRVAERELLHLDARRRQTMFDALLDGRGGDAAILEEALDALDLPAQGPYLVVLDPVSLELNGPRAGTTAKDVCAAYSFRASWRIRAGQDVGLVALGTSAPQRLVEALRAEVRGRVGVSDAIMSLRDVPEAFRLAETALMTVPRGSGEVAWISERLPEALVVSNPGLSRRLARRALGPLLSLPPAERDVLLETLAIWYRNGRSSARTSAELYCHRNTIVNRLRRIEALSGRSLDDHRYLLACYLGLLTLRHVPTAFEGEATVPPVVVSPDRV